MAGYTRKYIVNRFPIAAIIYYALAKKQGYDEETARALGYAAATFFAIMKNFKGTKTASKNGTKKTIGTGQKNQLSNEPKMSIYKLTLYAKECEGKKLPQFGGKLITTEDFNRMLDSKFRDKADKMLEHAKHYVEKFKDEEIKDGFHIYKEVRDVWRTPEFFNLL